MQESPTLLYMHYAGDSYLKVMGTWVYLQITVTRFMQLMPILIPPSTKSFLGSNPFRRAHVL